MPNRCRRSAVLLWAAAAVAGETAAELHFVEVGRVAGLRTPPPRIAGQPRYDYGPLWTDLDGDGRLDLLFMNHSEMPSIYLNRGEGRLVDRFERTGIRSGGWHYSQHADRHGAACADFDNDGDVDLFVSHGAQRGETLGVKAGELLEQGDDFTFVDVAEAAATRNEMGRARLPTWADLDGDGWLDLYVGNFESANALYFNRGDGTFSPAGAAHPLRLTDAAHPSWPELDRDGRPELAAVWPLRLFDNRGGGDFVEGRVAAGPRPHFVPSASSLAWGDFDGDGDADAFVASRIAGRSRLLRNDLGHLRPAAGDFGPPADEVGGGAAWGDLDNDGDLDLVAVDSRAAWWYENRGAGRLVRRPLGGEDAPRPGKDGDVALGDLDGDGGLEVAINTTAAQTLYRAAGARGRWLGLALVGRHSNRSGLGAEVTVRLPDGRTVSRRHLGDSGFFHSAGCGPLHLGLGDAPSAEAEIRWPRGRRQRLVGLPADHRIVVHEGGPVRGPARERPPAAGRPPSEVEIAVGDDAPARLLGLAGGAVERDGCGGAVVLGREPGQDRWRLEGRIETSACDGRAAQVEVRINGWPWRPVSAAVGGPLRVGGALPPTGPRVRLDWRCASAGEGECCACVRVRRAALLAGPGG